MTDTMEIWTCEFWQIIISSYFISLVTQCRNTFQCFQIPQRYSSYSSPFIWKNPGVMPQQPLGQFAPLCVQVFKSFEGVWDLMAVTSSEPCCGFLVNVSSVIGVVLDKDKFIETEKDRKNRVGRAEWLRKIVRKRSDGPRHRFKNCLVLEESTALTHPNIISRPPLPEASHSCHNHAVDAVKWMYSQALRHS